jgi:hypothetical protein
VTQFSERRGGGGFEERRGHLLGELACEFRGYVPEATAPASMCKGGARDL